MAETFAAAPLFDSNSPTRMAKAVASVSTALKSMASSISGSATSANRSLLTLENTLDRIISKSRSLGNIASGSGSSSSGNGMGSYTWGSINPMAANSIAASGASGQNPFGAWGDPGITTFNSISGGLWGTSAENSNGIATFGGNNGGPQAPTSGGGGGFSAGRAVVGAAAVGVGALANTAPTAIASGMGAIVAANNVRLATGWNFQTAANYSKQFQGWGGDYGQLTAGLQALGGAGGGGVRLGSASATQLLAQAGQFAQISRNLGTGVTFADAAGAQATLRTAQGRQFLRSIGINGVKAQSVNLFSVANLLSGQLDKARFGGANGGQLTASQVSSELGPGGAFYDTLAKGGFSSGEIQTLGAYLQMQQRSKTGFSAATNLGAARTASQINAVGKNLGILSNTTGAPAQTSQATELTANALEEKNVAAASTAANINLKAAQMFSSAVKDFQSELKILGDIQGASGSGVGRGVIRGGEAAIDLYKGYKKVKAVGSIIRAARAARAASGVEAGGDAAVAAGGDAAADVSVDAGLSATGVGLPVAAALAGVQLGSLARNWASSGPGQKGLLKTGVRDAFKYIPGIGLGADVGQGINKGLTDVGQGINKGLTGIWHMLGSGGPMAGSGSGGSSSPTPMHFMQSGTSASGSRVVADAEKYIGVPYVWGGTNPAIGLDCSGLVQLVYRQVGVNLPRTSEQQVRSGQPVAGLQNARPGDLLFYGGGGYDGTPSSPGHVGIYIGNGQMIDAPYPGSTVRKDGAGSPVAIRRVLGSNGRAATGRASSGGVGGGYIGNVPGGSGGGALGEGSIGSESGTLSGYLTPTMGGSPISVSGLGGNGAAGPSSGGMPTRASGVAGSFSGSEAQWAALLIRDAGAVPTKNNVANVMRWMAAEEPSSNWGNRNNPLNAGLGEGAANGTGSYTSLTAGAMWTARELQQSNFAGILNALKRNASTSQFMAAVVASPWASSHYAQEGGAAGLAGIKVPGYSIGSQYIDSDQMAMLHRGEMVINAGSAAAMRMNQLSGGNGTGSGVTVIIQQGALVYHAASSSSPSSAALGSNQTQRDAQQFAEIMAEALQKKLNSTAVRSD